MSGLSNMGEAIPDLMNDLGQSTIISAMPNTLATIVLSIIFLVIIYLIYIAYIWYITVPLGLFFTFLFIKKAKRKSAKILYAFLALFFLIPPIIAFFVYKDLLFVR